jgi:hypothetical protein
MTNPFFVNANAGGAATSPRRGIAIALPFAIGGGAAGMATSALRPRNSSQVLAIAAAAAIENRGEAFELARKARESPEEVLTQAFDEARVNAILAAVQVAQDDPGKDFEITSVHRAVAGATGANPRLVAAAAAALEVGGGQDARLWTVHLIDPGLLDRAARAAGRAEALKQLDTGTVAGGTNARLDKLEADRDTINTKLDELIKTVDELKKRRTPPNP